MSSLPETTRSLMEVFNGKLQDFTNAIDNVHMVWLEEIQQEAHRMFSSDFSTEPELMPKTPSQKKTNRRKRVSMELNESRSKRRFSKGKRSNLRRSSVQMTLITVSELVKPHVPSDSSESLMEEPSHRTRRNKTTAPTETKPVKRSTRNKGGAKAKDVEEVAESMSDVNEAIEVQDSSSNQDQNLVSEAMVKIPSSQRLSADLLLNAGVSPGRSADKIPIAAFGLQTTPQGSSRTSARRSLVVRRSLVGLRQSMTQEAVRRASRRSFLKKKARLGNSTCSSSVSEDICMDVETEEMENKEEHKSWIGPDNPLCPFVKNQMLMTTPGSLGRSTIIKSFIKQSATKTDTKVSRDIFVFQNSLICLVDSKVNSVRFRKRDERLKRVVEARVKGEKEKAQEKKKKIEEKLAQLEKKNDMLRVERLAEEKAKRKVATKRQEELELRKKQEEAARQKKLQQVEEEERRHQEMLAKRKAEEEREKARKLAEATRALELKKEQEREKEREQERERERERERQAAAEKERLEREKAIALQKELVRAGREKERMEMEKRKMEEQRKAEEEREAQQKRAAAASVSAAKTQANILNTTITKSSALNKTVDIENSVLNTPVGKGAAHNKTVDLGPGLNVTMDIEQSPQSYQITPKGQKVNVLVNPEDYGMDQNSDDSTDDESAPKKPIPSWAEGMFICSYRLRYVPSLPS
uniref:Inner centromere protein A n=1 Tax=Cyprinus carpio TaxID=7962 RepID=A0A8C2JWZ8_CYPCA